MHGESEQTHKYLTLSEADRSLSHGANIPQAHILRIRCAEACILVSDNNHYWTQGIRWSGGHVMVGLGGTEV